MSALTVNPEAVVGPSVTDMPGMLERFKGLAGGMLDILKNGWQRGALAGAIAAGALVAVEVVDVGTAAAIDCGPGWTEQGTNPDGEPACVPNRYLDPPQTQAPPTNPPVTHPRATAPPVTRPKVVVTTAPPPTAATIESTTTTTTTTLPAPPTTLEEATTTSTTTTAVISGNTGGGNSPTGGHASGREGNPVTDALPYGLAALGAIGGLVWLVRRRLHHEDGVEHKPGHSGPTVPKPA